MVINSRRLRYLTAFVFLFLIRLAAGRVPFLEAQSSGFFIDSEPRFIQRLVWSGGEYALRYEVVIEKLEGETYRGLRREFTDALFIEISLTPGLYRFNVIPYDILDKPGEPSQWMYIEVRRALRPELVEVPQEVSEDGTDEYLLDISGRNILPDSRIYLVAPDGSHIEPVEVINFEDDSGVLLRFDSGQIVSGEYELVVINPGGLGTTTGGITFTAHKPKPPKIKPLVIGIGASWSPFYPIYGMPEGGEFSFFSVALHANMLISVSADTYIGLEIQTALFFLDETSEINMQSVGGSLLVQKPLFDKKAAVNMRFGADYVFLENSGFYNVTAGVSFLLRFLEFIEIEAGIDYTHMLLSNGRGYLRPRAGIGFQF
jgi:hypothetical protein